MPQVLIDGLPLVWPHAIGVRVVRAPHDVVLSDEPDHFIGHELVPEGGVALTMWTQ